MEQRVQTGGLSVAASLHRFVEEEALPGTGLDPRTSGTGAAAIIHDLAPRNRELLARRDELQATSTTGTASTPARPTPRPTPRSSARSATCSTSRPRSPSRPTASTTRSP